MKHIIITGERGVGKSTLVNRLLELNTRPVAGFITKRLAPDASGFHPIYIHPADCTERVYTEANLVGTCDSKIHNCRPEVFDALGSKYLAHKQGDLVLMDELGFMESDALKFREVVMSALDGEDPVIAVVKVMDGVEFLKQVKAHSKAQVYTLTVENRESVYAELAEQIRKWN